MPAGDTAHSDRWQGPTSRGQRLTRKLGDRMTLRRLDFLLTSSVTSVTITDITKEVR